jgi:hypothetical protein
MKGSKIKNKKRVLLTLVRLLKKYTVLIRAIILIK